MHNIHYMMTLMRKAREAIMEDKYPDFLRNFFSTLYAGEKENYPAWAVTALRGVGVDLMGDP
jgi:queuine tRNA-ribosyltransferase catalytic subunit